MEKLVNDFCRSLDEDTIRESLETLGSPIDRNASVEQLVERLQKDIREIGIEELINKLDEQTITDWVASIPTLSQENFTAATLEDHVKSVGIDSFLQETEDESLRRICEDIGFEDVPESVSKRKNLLFAEFYVVGLESFFQLLTIPVLKKYCAHFGIPSSRRKQVLIENIVTKILHGKPVERRVTIKEEEDGEEPLDDNHKKRKSSSRSVKTTKKPKVSKE